eukprot:3197769-Rhodomonas_salina.2
MEEQSQWKASASRALATPCISLPYDPKPTQRPRARNSCALSARIEKFPQHLTCSERSLCLAGLQFEAKNCDFEDTKVTAFTTAGEITSKGRKWKRRFPLHHEFDVNKRGKLADRLKNFGGSRVNVDCPRHSLCSFGDRIATKPPCMIPISRAFQPFSSNPHRRF